MNNKLIIMLATSVKGGISSVIHNYQKAGLFERWPIVYLQTHKDGKKLVKASIAIKSLGHVIVLLILKKVVLFHLHVAMGASFWRKSLFIMFGKIFKCGIILHLHGSEFKKFYLGSKWISRFFIRLVFDRVDVIVVLSSQWKEFLISIGVKARIVIIFNSICYPENRKPIVDSRSTTSILFLGKLGQRKGIYDLLEVVANLKNYFPEIKLLCCGDGELDLVARRAEILNVRDYVEILGWVSGQAKEDLLNDATIFVLPSYNEGLPVAILEAMGAGLPVVSTRVGGIPDAIEDGIEGFLVEPGDVDSLQNVIKKLLEDSHLRERMGMAGKKKVAAQFASKITVPKLEALYRELGAIGIEVK